jgi:hypothetical protein
MTPMSGSSLSSPRPVSAKARIGTIASVLASRTSAVTGP